MAGRRPRALALLSILLGLWSVAFVNSAYKQTHSGAVMGQGQSQTGRNLFGAGGGQEVAGNSIYDFTVQDIDGQDVSLNEYNGKVVLIVNVASKWGLTKSNYAELCELYGKYKSRGFEVLAFPCNQFGGQEPGSNAEVKAFAQDKCPDTFPLFSKIDVNGENEAPLYSFLKDRQGEMLGRNIKWNFAKFLVDRQGQPVARYGPQSSPLSFEEEIVKLL